MPHDINDNIQDLAPLPWRVDQDGRIEDAKGHSVALITVRLNLGDGSWRIIANKIAAADEMFEALVLYEQGYEALANWERRKGEKLLEAAHQKRKAALAKARGEAL